MKDKDRLLWDIEKDGPFDVERTDRLRSDLHRESERKRKRWLISCFLYLLTGLGIMAYGGLMLKNAEEVRQMFLGSLMIIIGFETTVLIKLAYGNMFSLVRVLEMIKEVHLTLVDHIERQHAGTTVRDEGGGQS
jgi:hypothetical protein